MRIAQLESMEIKYIFIYKKEKKETVEISQWRDPENIQERRKFSFFFFFFFYRWSRD